MKLFLINVGLILDIIGAIIIFLFGISSIVKNGGASFLLLNRVDEKKVKKEKLYEFLSRVGLLLLIFGFIFQFIGNLLTK